MRFRGLVIWVIGARLFLRIPYRWRRRFGLAGGEDFSDLLALLERLRAASPAG